MKAELLIADLQAALVRLEDALKLDSELDVYKAGWAEYAGSPKPYVAYLRCKGCAQGLREA